MCHVRLLSVSAELGPDFPVCRRGSYSQSAKPLVTWQAFSPPQSTKLCLLRLTAESRPHCSHQPSDALGAQEYRELLMATALLSVLLLRGLT